MNPASNLILVGPMGAGKSTIGKRLAEQFGLAFFDLDHEIEARTGASVALIFELEGEELFKQQASLLYDKNELDELIALSRATLVERPNNPYARWYLARALVLKEDWPAALEELTQLRVSTPSWADIIEPILKDVREKLNEKAKPGELH